MKNIFFISDTHFSHSNIIKFTFPDGRPIRPGYTDDILQHDEILIERWNKTIGQHDKVYHLGDVGFKNKDRLDKVLSRLNGKKRLILGNHDTMDIEVYTKHFEKIFSWRHFGRDMGVNFVCCHYPLHPGSFEYRAGQPGWCVHGHIHEKLIMKDDGTPDPRYINVCVEHVNGTPVEFEELKRKMVR